MPICVFDIAEDGTATIPVTTDLTGPARYRWWHFDLADPQLAGWCQAHLPEIPASALLQPETRPRCDAYESGLIINLRGINLNEGQQTEEMVSVRMWVTDAAVVTVRVRRVYTLQELQQSAQSQLAPPSPAAFVTELVARLTNRIQQEVNAINALADFFEADLDDETTPVPAELTKTRRRVIRLRRFLDPQRAAINSIATTHLIPKHDHPALRELANRTTMAVEDLVSLQDRLSAVQDDHDLDAARKQARNGFILSVGAGIFLPISFITGLFGMNVGGMPGLDNKLAFTILCLIMLAMALALLAALRWIKWI